MDIVVKNPSVNEMVDRSTCPVCACSLKDNEELHICADCETPHHKDCWEYTGGCAIFGCRKGVLRKFEEDRRHSHFLTTFNLRLMHFWGKLLYIDLVLFLMGHYAGLAFTLGATSGISVCLVFFTLPILSRIGLPFVAFLPIFGYVALFIFCIFLLACAGWCALVLPFGIMRIHFWRLEVSVESKKMDKALQLATRVELPDNLVSLANRFYSIGRKITLVILQGTVLLSGILIVISLILSKSLMIFMPLAIVVGLLTLLYYRFLPATQGVMEERLTFISAFQNRLIASAKQSKG